MAPGVQQAVKCGRQEVCVYVCGCVTDGINSIDTCACLDKADLRESIRNFHHCFGLSVNHIFWFSEMEDTLIIDKQLELS